jgi:dihydroorotate dehydrogenase
MFYSLIRSALFQLDAETAHNVALHSIKRMPFVVAQKVVDDPVEILGIKFPNRVGLAAGLDKNADYFEELAGIGFGFVEVGTVTPKAQPGNDKPRMFRLPKHQAIINRLGFNNKGVEHLVKRINARKANGIVGINIGKNKTTPNENAVDDYIICLNAVYELADYITVNISSPNTPDLRDLQFGESLRNLLSALKAKQLELSESTKRYVPLLVKIAPDLDESAVIEIAKILVDENIDGVIATNTTISREDVVDSKYADEAGGLSGLPVQQKSNQVISLLRKSLPENYPIIGVGGVMSAQDAVDKIKAGADLVQIYTGFIYNGPELITQAANAIKNFLGKNKKI